MPLFPVSQGCPRRPLRYWEKTDYERMKGRNICSAIRNKDLRTQSSESSQNLRSTKVAKDQRFLKRKTSHFLRSFLYFFLLSLSIIVISNESHENLFALKRKVGMIRLYPLSRLEAKSVAPKIKI